MTEGPSRSIEVEVTFDADADTQLPDWTLLPGIVSVRGPEIRDLDAAYADTAAGDLARAGYAIRRRTGGPDAGWHLKGPVIDGGRTELQWPLTDELDVPDAVHAAVADITTGPLLPLARIRNERHAYELVDADGAVVAEMVDDHVATTDLRSGTERAWREWELELGAAGPTAAERNAFFAAAAELAHGAGARPASSASKLARALGH